MSGMIGCAPGLYSVFVEYMFATVRYYTTGLLECQAENTRPIAASYPQNRIPSSFHSRRGFLSLTMLKSLLLFDCHTTALNSRVWVRWAGVCVGTAWKRSAEILLLKLWLCANHCRRNAR